MIDREQVIKGIETHIDNSRSCKKCPYFDERPCCLYKLMDDAIALIREQQELLKAQTPVKPVKSKLSWEHGYNWDIWDCGHCGSQLRSDANYCDRCGHKVNWDDMEESDV